MNIYNVKMSKTEMACAPPKTCQNQKSFWDPSTYHPNTTGVGWFFFISKKHVLVGHPSPQFYLNSVWDGIPDIPNVSLLQGNDSSSDGEV